MALFRWSLLALLGLTGVAPAQEGAVRGVHDPCAIKADGSYFLFCTGPGVPIRRSRDLFHWERAGRVFDSNPAWFSQISPSVRSIWAPDISYFGGEYHLYYSVSTFGSNRSAIGVATNQTLDSAKRNYNWVDRGLVIESRRTDDFNAIDPNLVLDVEGRTWLAFGSFWSGIELVAIDPKTGKPPSPRPDRISLAARPGNHEIEAPFLIRHDQNYFLFVSVDRCCRGVNSTYNVVVGRSHDVKGPYVDRDGKSMLEGGGTQVLAGSGRVRGPGHNGIIRDGDRDWFVHHFYDADASGTPTLQIRPLIWGRDGWPRVGEPIRGPVERSL